MFNKKVKTGVVNDKERHCFEISVNQNIENALMTCKVGDTIQLAGIGFLKLNPKKDDEISVNGKIKLLCLKDINKATGVVEIQIVSMRL